MNKHVHITIFDFTANTFAAGTSFAGGRINKTNNSYDINYFITDHLGSTRVIVDNAGNIKEQKDYYPFGKEHENANLMSSTNRWGYNGKEKQIVGNLNYLDYINRMYDPEIGRWFVQDPLQEKYYSWSSYNYCMNNPLKYVDPDGKQASTAIRFLRNPFKFITAIKYAILGTGTGIIYNHFVDGDRSTEVANSLVERAKSIDEARAASQEQINYQKRQQSLSGAEEVDISTKHNQNMRDNNSDGDGNGKGGKPKGGTIMKIVGGTAATIGVISTSSKLFYIISYLCGHEPRKHTRIIRQRPPVIRGRTQERREPLLSHPLPRHSAQGGRTQFQRCRFNNRHEPYQC